MDTGYLLIDLATDLIYGPYFTLAEARYRAERLEQWEILDNGKIVDWGANEHAP